MEIFGRERGFLMTIGAAEKISEICPDQDIQKMYQLFDDKIPMIERMKNAAAVICYMNEGYEENRAYNDPGYQPDPLRVEQVKALSIYEINAMQAMAVEAAVPQSKVETVANGKKK